MKVEIRGQRKLLSRFLRENSEMYNKFKEIKYFDIKFALSIQYVRIDRSPIETLSPFNNNLVLSACIYRVLSQGLEYHQGNPLKLDFFA